MVEVTYTGNGGDLSHGAATEWLSVGRRLEAKSLLVPVKDRRGLYICDISQAINYPKRL